MRKTMIMAGLAVLSAAAVQAAAGTAVSIPYVKPAHPSFRGIFGTATRTNAAELVAGTESLRTMTAECSIPLKKNRDGTMTLDLKGIHNCKGGELGDYFVIRPNCRVSVYPGHFYEAEFRHDQAEYEAWKKAHPGFSHFSMYELGNDAYMKWRVPHELKRRNNPVSDETLSRLSKLELPPTCKEYVWDVLRPHFDRVVEWCFNDKEHMLVGEGMECIEHLFAYWGVKEIGIETTRDRFFWQIQMLFCRGAARQFSLPWQWYIASYNSGSTFFAEDHPEWKYHGPAYGISQSAVKRVTYLTWLSGANAYQREAMEWTHMLSANRAKAELSCEGKMYDAFYHFIKGRDRGRPFTPFALLVPYARGYSRKGGAPFMGKYPYTHPDYMLDAFISTVLEFPRNRLASESRRNIERVMANSRYGDLYDALTPDFADQTSFKAAIGGYPVAVLFGEYGWNPAMAKILRDYVRGGGTLVMSSAQLESVPFDMKAAEVLANPEFSALGYGRGRVIVGKTPHFTPWYGDDEAGRKKALADTAGEVPRRYPDIEWLLSELYREFVPVSVDGFVQWGLNRMEKGYLLYLVNNGGVVKKWDEPEKIAPGGEMVTVDLSRLRHGRVREILAGAEIADDGGKIRLLVPSGDLRILEIAED